jgi:hypothetical protein
MYILELSEKCMRSLEIITLGKNVNTILYASVVNVDRLCGLVIRVPGYTKECASCEVRTEFICVTLKADRLWSGGQEFLATEPRCIVLPMSHELNVILKK